MMSGLWNADDADLADARGLSLFHRDSQGALRLTEILKVDYYNMKLAPSHCERSATQGGNPMFTDEAAVPPSGVRGLRSPLLWRGAGGEDFLTQDLGV